MCTYHNLKTIQKNERVSEAIPNSGFVLGLCQPVREALPSEGVQRPAASTTLPVRSGAVSRQRPSRARIPAAERAQGRAGGAARRPGRLLRLQCLNAASARQPQHFNSQAWPRPSRPLAPPPRLSVLCILITPLPAVPPDVMSQRLVPPLRLQATPSQGAPPPARQTLPGPAPSSYSLLLARSLWRGPLL